MIRTGQAIAAAIAILSAAPAPAEEPACEFCIGDNPGAEMRPLRIEIESGLQFSRLALLGRQDGAARIDPKTGEKHVGSNMIDLGGLTFQGKATITGQPLKPVRIDLPRSVVLHSVAGGEAELSDFRTDLPQVAMLDANGQLQFNFGATITSKNAQGGDFRGRIPIRVEYY